MTVVLLPDVKNDSDNEDKKGSHNKGSHEFSGKDIRAQTDHGRIEVRA